MTITINDIPVEMCNLLHKFQLLYESRHNVVVEILSNPNIQITNERFQKYQKELDLYYENYKKACFLFESIYVLPNIPDNQQLNNWYLDYRYYLLKIYCKLKEEENNEKEKKN